MDLGSFFGGIASAGASALWDQKEKGRDREYATKMSNTAHQREVADLRAAGLNPILSAGGRGASSPAVGGTSAQSMAQGISSLSQASSAKHLRDASVKKVSADARNADVNAKMNESMYDLYRSNDKLRKIVDASRLGEESGLGGWIRSIGSGIKGLFRTSPKHVVNKTYNQKIRNHNINQRIGSQVDTDTGEIIPPISELFKN